MTADLTDFADRVIGAANELGLPVDPVLVTRLRDRAAALVASPSVQARHEWEDALRAVAGDRLVAVVVRAWGLLELPGAPRFLAGLVARAASGDAGLRSGVDAGLELGPLQLGVAFPPVVLPVAGQAPVVAGLVGPSTLSAHLSVGPVTVGGAVALHGTTWAGALAGSFGTVRAGAMGVLRTGSVASFAAVLGARFQPGLQVGFGFEITTIGGIVGVNVGLDPGALRAALSSGAAVAMFFPASPGELADQQARLDLIPRVFPEREGSVVAGPAFEVTWLQLVGFSALRLSVVALLELPRGRFVVLGSAAILIPVVLDLRLDVMGEIDPAAGFVAADLAVVSGRMLGLLRVDGTAALRVRSSEPAAALFTIGGFYPGYRAAVPGLPPQRRISVGSDLPLPLSFRYEGYLAVTDGTFQVGARVEIGFEAGVEVHGFLQFDAIGQYDPFHVHAQLAGGVDVGALGMSFGGVDFHGVIDGPGPVVVSGRVSVEFLGAEAGWEDSFRIGLGSAPPPPPPVEDVVGLLVTHEERQGDLGGRLTIPPGDVVAPEANDPLVDVDAPTRVGDLAVIRPLGVVTWSQTVAPLDTPITRVRGRRLSRQRSLVLSNLPDGVRAGPTAQFSPAALCDPDRDTLLLLPAYEPMPSGVEVGGARADLGTARFGSLDYEEHYKDPPNNLPLVIAFLHLAPGIAAALGRRHDPAVTQDHGPSVSLTPEDWTVLRPDGRDTTPTRTAAVLDARLSGGTAIPRDEPALGIGDLWGP